MDAGQDQAAVGRSHHAEYVISDGPGIMLEFGQIRTASEFDEVCERHQIGTIGRTLFVMGPVGVDCETGR